MSLRVVILVPDPSNRFAKGILSAIPAIKSVEIVTLVSTDSLDPTLLKDVVGIIWIPITHELDELRRLLEVSHCKWVHVFSAGIDTLVPVLPFLRSSNTVVTNGRGAFSESLAEYIMAAALHFNKQFSRCENNRKSKIWEKFTIGTLSGKTMGFVGFGDIAKAAAVRATAFGMRLIAVRRHASHPTDSLLALSFRSDEDLTSFYEQCDFVVCTLPLTPQTKGFVGAAAFACMKPSAVFISLGRGPVVDESALVAALQQRSIAGAACDVFEVEPLPQNSPLWECDNLLLTAHNADLTEDFYDRGWRVWRENYESLEQGTPFATPVDLEAGY